MLQIIKSENVPNSFLPALNGREVSLWIHRTPDGVDVAELVDFIGLPWRDVFISETDKAFRDALSAIDKPDMVRKRGYAQIIRSDPSLLSLPPRALPIYLLDGGEAQESNFDKTLRRFAMLGGLRRSGVRQLLVISDEDATLPPELADLLDVQFRPIITQVSETQSGEQIAESWVQSDATRPTVQFVKIAPIDFYSCGSSRLR
ncbi:hypothetical protein [Sphingomonas sp. Ant H11]|uniref:hypothetical protein n=1 Tax=Sphingomonas sp. Ant H11 TaxID=1564113 RepID=UPI00053EC4AE|nr:hypothetical protein [Sphingomonas sp. Ant H11]